MTNEFIHSLKERMEKRGFSVEDDKLAQFSVYCQELRDWNTKVNLTSLTDDLDIIDKHFIDSLLIFQYETLKQGIRIADVGTGAGFPGLPIKIYRPDVQLLLLESIGKKTRFLKHIVSKLGFDNVIVANERAEVLAQSLEHRESYDLVVARCVARLPILAEYCLPLASMGGMFVAYKGQEAEIEVRESESALEKLGGKFERIEHDSSYPDRRALVFIKKVKKTPEQYPRRSGMPQKKPL